MPCSFLLQKVERRETFCNYNQKCDTMENKKMDSTTRPLSEAKIFIESNMQINKDKHPVMCPNRQCWKMDDIPAPQK